MSRLFNPCFSVDVGGIFRRSFVSNTIKFEEDQSLVEGPDLENDVGL